MNLRSRRLSLSAVAVTAAVAALATTVTASPHDGPDLTNVQTANTKSEGYSPATKLSPELTETVLAQGSTKVENPSSLASYYGYFNDVLNSAGEPQMLPTPTSNIEAAKSEPDKNTYLMFNHLAGADHTYDYGRHFLFQGHEGGLDGASYITRINLDADAAHRVTLLATTDSSGAPIAPIDGSTWDPWAHRLLFTTEDSSEPTYSGTPSYPSSRHRHLGRARAWRLRGHPGRFRRQHLDRRGRRRSVQGRDHREAAQQLPVSLRAEAPGRPQPRQAPGPAGAQRCRQPGHVRQPGGFEQSRSAGAAYVRQELQNQVDHDPQHRHGREHPVQRQYAGKGGRRDAVQATREWAVPTGRRVPAVLLRRDGRHRCDQPRERERGRLGLGLQAHSARPQRQHRNADAVLQRRRGPRGVRQRRRSCRTT